MSASSCNWCHEIVDFSDHFCSTCNHAAHLPRMDCDCNRCGGQRLSAHKVCDCDDGVYPGSITYCVACGKDLD